MAFGAEAFGAQGGHGGTHAEAASFVGGGADDGAVAQPGDDDGLAAQLRIVALLDRGVEGVHVDVDDLANGHGRRVAGKRRLFRVSRWLMDVTQVRAAQRPVK
jgi:hypothetical protein